MTNWEKSKEELEKNGILTIDNIPDNVIDYLKNNISDISYNHSLAGQIKGEFEYRDWPQFISKFIIDQTFHPMIQHEIERHKLLSSGRPFFVNSLWANVQKKYEFNPLHEHSGILSFIIFLKVPYDLEDEEKVFPKSAAKFSPTSKLVFLLFDSVGRPRDHQVSVDKSFENKMLMFPAKMQHMVYPFYTSDEPRISVSGNLLFWVD